MRQKSGPVKESAEKVVRDIRRATRRHFSAEDKIRIVLEGLRGEESIVELCRREGIVQNLYYRWSKDFLEAGKKRLAGDTARAATSDEVKHTKAGAVKTLFERFDAMLRVAEYIAMPGQIIDASLSAAPRQRNTDGEKKAKEGRVLDEKEKPARLRQKDRGARWIVKFTKPSRTRTDLCRASTSRSWSSVIKITSRSIAALSPSRKWSATDAADYEGRRQLREGLLDKMNTASGTAYRSAANEAFMDKNGYVSHVHRKKPKGVPYPTRSGERMLPNRKSGCKVEHAFAEQKDRMDLFIRTLASPERRRRSDGQTSSTTSSACFSCADPQPHDRRSIRGKPAPRRLLSQISLSRQLH